MKRTCKSPKSGDFGYGPAADMRCPICEKEFDPAASQALPFCSPRCRQIDLRRWLDERYALPIERPDGDEEQGEEREDPSRN